MMAKYRKIDPRIWNDEKFRGLSSGIKLVALYCLTAQCNRIGIFRFSVALAAEDMGLSTEVVGKSLDTLCDTLSWKYDKANRILYFPHWWRYNNPGSSKTMAGLLTDLHELPQTPLLADFMTNTDSLSDTLCKTLSTFHRKGMPYQEQEQEQEQETKGALAKAEPTKKKSPPFQKPTVDEVQAYCRERRNRVDPQQWLDHYESNGWRVGRNPMKDWKAAIRTWEKNDFGTNPTKEEPDEPSGPLLR